MLRVVVQIIKTITTQELMTGKGQDVLLIARIETEIAAIPASSANSLRNSTSCQEAGWKLGVKGHDKGKYRLEVYLTRSSGRLCLAVSPASPLIERMDNYCISPSAAPPILLNPLLDKRREKACQSRCSAAAAIFSRKTKSFGICRIMNLP